MRTDKRPGAGPTTEQVARRIQRTRDALARRWRGRGPAHERLVNLALSEAAALAWQSGVPQLVFPTLAMEKLAAINRWWAKQDQIRRQPLADPPAEWTQQFAE